MKARERDRERERDDTNRTELNQMTEKCEAANVSV